MKTFQTIANEGIKRENELMFFVQRKCPKEFYKWLYPNGDKFADRKRIIDPAGFAMAYITYLEELTPRSNS